MPWNSGDASRHTKKADTPRRKRQWSDVANSVRAREIARGVPEDRADADAVRTANGVVRRGKKK